MKSNRKCITNGNGSASQSIRLEFIHPNFKSVSVAGDFNDARPGATEMVAVGEGRWLKDLARPPGTYEHLFEADGQWLADPLARETVPNPFGSVNSVIEVPGDPRVNVRAWLRQTRRQSVIS